MKKVYVAHPYEAKEENKKKVEKLINHLLKEWGEKYMFISPIHLFGYIYEAVPYEHGIEMCFQTLKDCDLLLIADFDYIKNSKGCLMELGFAKGKGIEIEYWLDDYYRIVNEE